MSINDREYIDNQNVTLKEHIAEVFKEFKDSLDVRFKLVDTQILNIEKAIQLAREEASLRIVVAEEASERRLNILNEFRKTVEDWTSQAATKESLESTRSEVKLIVDKIETLEKTNYERLSKDIEELKLSKAELSGKAGTWQVVVAYIVAIIGIIISIVK